MQPCRCHCQGRGLAVSTRFLVSTLPLHTTDGLWIPGSKKSCDIDPASTAGAAHQGTKQIIIKTDDSSSLDGAGQVHATGSKTHPVLVSKQ